MYSRNPYLSLLEKISARGINVKSIGGTEIFEVSHNGISHLLSQYTLPIIPNLYPKILDNKKNFKAILRHYNIPHVIDSRSFLSNELENALKYVNDEIGFPIVCKPHNGRNSSKVFCNILDEKQMKQIWRDNYKDELEEVVVEKYLNSTKDCRIFLFKDIDPCVTIREAPHVIGDGLSSIKELVEKENIRRQKNNKYTQINLENKDAVDALQNQGIESGDIIKNGTKISLGYCADINNGGTYQNILATQVHEEYIDLAYRIWDIFPKMPYFSVDFLIKDLKDPPSNTIAGISEAHVGATPILTEPYPTLKGDVDVLEKLVDILFNLD